MALPTFEEFKARLCSAEFACTYEETRIEYPPPGSKKYFTGGCFRRAAKTATFIPDNIGQRMDIESICSIVGRLGISGEAFGVTCRRSRN